MSFEAHAVEGLVRRSVELADEWLTLVERRAPSGTLSHMLHMTRVLQHVARFVADETYPLTEQAEVVEPLRRFAALRRHSDAGPAQLLRDFDMMAEVLDHAATELLASYEGAVRADEVARVTTRLQRVPLLLGTIAIDAFWRDDALYGVAERLQKYTNAVTDELKRPLDAAAVTAQLLEYADSNARSAEAKRLTVLIQQNLARAEAVLQSMRLTALTPHENGAKAEDNGTRVAAAET
jgi:hypothetical protein